jgi:uncharacterized protein
MTDRELAQLLRVVALMAHIGGRGDGPKRPTNLAKHGLDFAALTQAFFEQAVIYPGKQGRLRAVGNLKQGTPWTVVFALRGNEAVSVVSMRHASKKQREDARTKTS